MLAVLLAGIAEGAAGGADAGPRNLPVEGLQGSGAGLTERDPDPD